MAQQDNGTAWTVDLSLESTLDSVDIAETDAVRLAHEIGFDEDAQHEIGMAVRECMVNAVVHGNRYNTRKKVYFRLAREGNRLTIVVRDEGEGFELSSLPDPLADENLLRQSGRGLLLIQAFMDEFDVHKVQPFGTEVRMVKALAGAS